LPSSGRKLLLFSCWRHSLPKLYAPEPPSSVAQMLRIRHARSIAIVTAEGISEFLPTIASAFEDFHRGSSSSTNSREPSRGENPDSQSDSLTAGRGRMKRHSADPESHKFLSKSRGRHPADTARRTLNLRVIGSIPMRLTIRLAFGEPQARSWRASLTSNALSDLTITRVEGPSSLRSDWFRRGSLQARVAGLWPSDERTSLARHPSTHR
jgi:hypothetical protein